jgi:hypothetical protein
MNKINQKNFPNLYFVDKNIKISQSVKNDQKSPFYFQKSSKKAA